MWIGKKSNFHEKKAQKVDFRNYLDPFWGFTLKTVLGVHDPRISWLLFGTKNHEMRGPPVIAIKQQLLCIILCFYMHLNCCGYCVSSQKFKFSMIFGTFSFKGCKGQPLLLIWNIRAKKNQQNYWAFYPSEPFTFGPFNMRDPVAIAKRYID